MRPHQDERTRRMKCFNCDFIHYLNPSPAAGVLVFDDHGQILLVQRAFEPYKGTWVIPSGYVEYDEGIKITAVRELKEETGLDVEIAGIHAVESCFDDPRGNTIIVIFNGIITGGELIAGDDAMDARFFHLADLPEIGFECQRRIISGLKENIS
ncbi:MAG: NUDIX domain-containing protein [Candidatus Krumholzibacteriota bacterium]|nr:NUDIX domain-containing protein [Candidatus Krumholzibacteriota bacterium]